MQSIINFPEHSSFIFRTPKAIFGGTLENIGVKPAATL